MEDKDFSITFYRKNPLECPVCGTEFYVEELKTGRGRIIAAHLDDELRQYYQENKKYGKVFPLIYPVIVCPNCYFAIYQEDFDRISKHAIERLMNNTDDRIKKLQSIFTYVDFTEPRTLRHGCASYMLATTCYSFVDKKFAPTFRKAISCLRGSWLFKDYYKETGEEQWNYVAQIFYKKAALYYQQTILKEQKGDEPLELVKHAGPDITKNWGYDGIKYISSLLNYKISFLEPDLEKRAESYMETKRVIARLFGLGKSSKEKPTAILEYAKNLYEEIGVKVKEIEEALGKKITA